MAKLAYLGLAVLGLFVETMAGAQSAPGQPAVFEMKVEVASQDYDVQYQFNRLLRPGQLEKVRNGVPGSVSQIFEVTLLAGKEVSRRMISEVRVEPIPAVFQMGKSRQGPSRGSFSRGQVITCESTAYLARGRTASGRAASEGLVAVDPNVIPLGSHLFIEGYGYAIAADTGGAIKGKIVDVAFSSAAACRAWGRRDVRVHILKRGK